MARWWQNTSLRTRYRLILRGGKSLQHMRMRFLDCLRRSWCRSISYISPSKSLTLIQELITRSLDLLLFMIKELLKLWVLRYSWESDQQSTKCSKIYQTCRKTSTTQENSMMIASWLMTIGTRSHMSYLLSPKMESGAKSTLNAWKG